MGVLEGFSDIVWGIFGDFLGNFGGFFGEFLGNLFSVGVQWASMEFNTVSTTLVFPIEKA